MAYMECVVEQDIIIHWRRIQGEGCVPVLAHSRRTDALKECVRDRSSQLDCIQGLEEAILPVIAAYCGLAVIAPCCCCKDGAPFRYCGRQAKPIQVGPITTTSVEETAVEFVKPALTYEKYLPLPLTLYHMLEREDLLYQSEQQRFTHDDTWDWDWTDESYEKLKNIPWSRNGGALCRTYGTGYLVLTSQGLYSNKLNLNWESLRKYNINCDRTEHEKGYQYSLVFDTREEFPPYDKACEWEVEDEKGNREEKTMELKAVDTTGQEAAFFFPNLDEFQKCTRIILTKLQKPLEFVRKSPPYWYDSLKTTRLGIVQNSTSAQTN